MNERRIYLSEVPNNATEVTADNYANLTFNVIYVPCYRTMFLNPDYQVICTFKKVGESGGTYIKMPTGETVYGSAAGETGYFILYNIRMSSYEGVSALKASTTSGSTPLYSLVPITVNYSDKTFLCVKYRNYAISNYSDADQALYGYMKVELITSHQDQTLQLGKFAYFSSTNCKYPIYVDTE